MTCPSSCTSLTTSSASRIPYSRTATFSISGPTCASWPWTASTASVSRPTCFGPRPAPFPAPLLVRSHLRRCCAGTVVCKQEEHKSGSNRGYIAMLVVEDAYRGLGVGSKLVRMSIEEMQRRGADEVVLEAEVRGPGRDRGPGSAEHLHRPFLTSRRADDERSGALSVRADGFYPGQAPPSLLHEQPGRVSPQAPPAAPSRHPRVGRLRCRGRRGGANAGRIALKPVTFTSRSRSRKARGLRRGRQRTRDGARYWRSTRRCRAPMCRPS